MDCGNGEKKRVPTSSSKRFDRVYFSTPDDAAYNRNQKKNTSPINPKTQLFCSLSISLYLSHTVDHPTQIEHDMGGYARREVCVYTVFCDVLSLLLGHIKPATVWHIPVHAGERPPFDQRHPTNTHDDMQNLFAPPPNPPPTITSNEQQ